jgi:cell division protein FtsQ
MAAVVLFTPVFAVRSGEITVRGIDGVVTEQSVTDALNPAVGVPLARLDLGELTAGLEQLAGVKSAVVQRKWPTGLEVQIAARLPVAAVPDGAAWVLLDAEAVAVARVEAQPAGLPAVEVPLDGPNRRTLGAVLDALRAMPGSVRGRVSDIGADTQDTVHFTLDGGKSVVWGDASDAALKAAALEVLLGRPAAEYNVSAPTMPFLRAHEAASAG